MPNFRLLQNTTVPSWLLGFFTYSSFIFSSLDCWDVFISSTRSSDPLPYVLHRLPEADASRGGAAGRILRLPRQRARRKPQLAGDCARRWFFAHRLQPPHHHNIPEAYAKSRLLRRRCPQPRPWGENLSISISRFQQCWKNLRWNPVYLPGEACAGSMQEADWNNVSKGEEGLLLNIARTHCVLLCLLYV